MIGRRRRLRRLVGLGASGALLVWLLLGATVATLAAPSPTPPPAVRATAVPASTAAVPGPRRDSGAGSSLALPTAAAGPGGLIPAKPSAVSTPAVMPTAAGADQGAGAVFLPPTRTPPAGESTPKPTSSTSLVVTGPDLAGPAVILPPPPPPPPPPPRPSPLPPENTPSNDPDVVAGRDGVVVRRPSGAIGSYPQAAWDGSCDRALRYWELVETAAGGAQADPQVLAALLAVEGSGERAVSPAGALGLMQLLPDKFSPGDDPFHVETNLRRAAELVARLQASWGSADRVAAAYFGAIDGAGNVTSATDGNVDGHEYVRRFQASLACVRSGLGVPGETRAALVSPLGTRLAPGQISFGFLDDYGSALASYIRGAHAVERYGTLHLAWDLVVPGALNNGRGYPVFAPLAGRIVRTSDPVGGPNGIWLESAALNLRVRLMHLDTLAPAIVDGARVHAGQWVGTLGGQGTEEFPHLHLSFELLSSGERLDPAQFYFRNETRPLVAATPVADSDGSSTLRLDGLGQVDQLQADGRTAVWLAESATGPVLSGYDLGSGWAFRVGSVDAVQPSAPSVDGNIVVWLDRRHLAADAAPERADIFAYDLLRGQERRLTDYAADYVNLRVDGQYVAWINRDDPLGYLELYDLATDTRHYVDGSMGQPRELSFQWPLLTWIDRSTAANGEAADELHIYDFRNDLHQRLPAQARAEPVIVGDTIFWLEQPSDGPGRLIRGRDLKSGREWAVTSTPAPRWGLQAADGELLWQELSPDGQGELRLYGIASGETRVLAKRPFAAAVASLGQGTVVWPEASDALTILTLPAWDLPNGRFYAEPNGQREWAARTGYSITNQSGINFWDEYRRLGGLAALGRPVSERIRLTDGWYYQATERAVLQWRTDLGQAVVLNPLEWLEARGLEADLQSNWQVPPASVEASATPQLDLLTDPRIRERYLSRANVPDQPWSLDEALAWYGPPLSPPQDVGAFIAQRFQRAALRRPKTPQAAQTATGEAALQPLGTAVRDLVFDAQYGGHDAPEE